MITMLSMIVGRVDRWLVSLRMSYHGLRNHTHENPGTLSRWIRRPTDCSQTARDATKRGRKVSLFQIRIHMHELTPSLSHPCR
jgi:hypothetical protein